MEGSAVLICVIIRLCVHVTCQSSPELTIPVSQSVVSVTETEAKQKKLADDITCSGGKNDATRVYVQSTFPNIPCGKCFAIHRVDEKYRLIFTPSLGTLNSGAAASYLLTVACTDDDTSDIGTIQVIVTANSPPAFVSPTTPFVRVDVRATVNKRAGDLLRKVEAVDDDQDAVFYSMEAESDSDLFEIGYGSGKILAAKDLRLLCDDSVKVTAFATDRHHQPVNSVDIEMTFKAGNIPPVIDETRTEVTIPEDAAVGTLVLPQAISLDDSTVYDTAIYKLRAEPERGLEYYTLTQKAGKARIVTRKELDYEYEYLRTVTLFVDVTDGFCDAETYSFTVTIEDVNEEPVILPNKIRRTVYEGLIELDPGWKIIDPDEYDQDIRWEAESAAFYADQVSGIVYSKEEYDIDPNTPERTRMLDAKVKDEKGEKATATLIMTIKDKNDNAPYFNTKLYKVTASNCTKPGALLTKLIARDDDSESEGNNVLVFSGAGNNIAVLATGHVTLTTVCVPGHTESIEAHVTDQGTYPGPLSGVPATVQFTCNVCPTPTTDDNSNSTDTTDDGGENGNDADSLALNLVWGIVAAILALLLAAVLAYVIWKYCAPACARWERRRALRRKAGGRRTVTPKPARKLKQLEPEPEIIIPPPPTPPPPDPDPLFFSFWKETYVDRDQRHTPQRDVTPASVEKDKVVEEENKEEEKKEKEERKLERQKVEEEYRQNVEKYHQEILTRTST